MKNKQILDKNNNNSNNKCIGNILSSCFFSLPPKQFSLLSSVLGILLIDDLSLEQQNSIGNFIVSVGQSILTAAAQGQAIESSNKKNDEIRKQIEKLKKEICELERDIN